jgi:hypothetical protein
LLSVQNRWKKSDIIFKASFNEFSSSARDNVESSAYWLKRNSEFGIQYSLAKDDKIHK